MTTFTTGRRADARTAPSFAAVALHALPDPPELPDPRDPLGFPGYADRLADLDGAESLETGTVRLGEVVAPHGSASLGDPRDVVDDDLEVVVARGRFDVLGGSMGTAHGDRLAHAAAYAREHRLPLVVVTSSGGARMQEGMRSLVQMARAAEAVRTLREAGVPLLALLTHPTTGGVYASYGSSADVTVAVDGATIGFAGPRVVEAFTGESVGDDSHTAAAAGHAGLVDLVTDAARADLAVARWASLLHPAARGGALPDADHVDEPTVDLDAWAAVRRARRTDRPSARDLLAQAFDGHAELHGDRVGGADDPAVVTALARLGDRTVVVVGFDRRGARRDGVGRGAHPGRPGQATAAGYRQLQRALRLARRHDLPVVALVDTPGADPSPASDRDGLAAAIAETFVACLEVPGPTVAVVTGEGGSGGALAIAATDRVLQQDDAVFEVIAPEGAAAILHRDPTRAEEVAGALAPTAPQLRRLGIIDRIVPGPTTFDPRTASTALRAELSVTLRELDADPQRRERRAQRYGPR